MAHGEVALHEAAWRSMAAVAGTGLPPAVGAARWLTWCSTLGAPFVSAALPGVCGEVLVGAGVGCGIGGRRSWRAAAPRVVFGPSTVVCGARGVSGWGVRQLVVVF